MAVLRPAKAAVTYTESSGEDVGMTTAKKFLMRSRRTRWHNLRTRENNVGGGGELQWLEMEEARGGGRGSYRCWTAGRGSRAALARVALQWRSMRQWHGRSREKQGYGRLTSGTTTTQCRFQFIQIFSI
jgi:hypothetical protein